MTRYRLVARPELGPFDFATDAVLAGLLLGLEGDGLSWIAEAATGARA